MAGRPFHITRELLDDIAEHGLMANVAGLHKALLVLHSPTDDTVGIDNATRIFVAAKHPKSFVSLAGADHLLSDRRDAAYVADVIGEQLPAVAAQGIARSCDVFCETGVFDESQSRRILSAAAEAGLALRLHADELAPSGGAELAAELAELGCLSADHLAAPSEQGIAALARVAEAGRPVVATLLPATSWFLGKHHFAPARRFIDTGVPVALATDLNPGTSPTLSLPLVMPALRALWRAARASCCCWMANASRAASSCI